MHWQYATSTIPQDLTELRKLMLLDRNLHAEAEQNAFFHPVDPMKLTPADVGIDERALQAAVDRILLAKERGEEVVIFGDYDADGVCSTAIMWEGLKAVGIIAKPFLPHREKHGYGLTDRSLTAVLEETNPKLLITVDNGIVAHHAFAELKKRGIDTILTDHHTPEETYPDANVIVHSTQLCGSTVAWFVARALSEEAARASLDLTSIATIADQMILLHANRSFVVHGMEALKKTKRVGLQLLMARAKVELDKISSETINYVIAPRINAMGRLKHSINALRLVCTTSYERAESLVSELNETNSARQELTVEMIDHAMEQAVKWETEHIIIVAHVDYHEGVIGLLASKLVETYNKPAIAIAIGERIAKASARSIRGVNITDLIREVRSDLLEVGGHPMAAGFAAEPAKLEIVIQRLQDIARIQITEEMMKPRLEVEVQLPENLVTLSTAEMVQTFAPFGNGNHEPIFALPTATLIRANEIGKEGKHLKLEVGFQTAAGQKTLPCISWGNGNLANELHVGDPIDVAGALSINEWKSRKSLQLMMKDLIQN